MIGTTTRQQQTEKGRGAPAEAPAQAEAQAAVYCEICGAGYAPAAKHQDLLGASPWLLESAFMSSCHYCFRCRRPACPACWDWVHGVCCACVQEAHLPFRAQAPLLPGVVFPPLQQSPVEEEAASSFFVCVRPGRLQAQQQTRAQAAHTRPQAHTAAGSSRPQTLRDSVLERQPSLGALWTVPQVAYVYVSDAVVPAPSSSAAAGEEQPTPDAMAMPQSTFGRVWNTLERIVTVMLMLILLAVIGLVVFAEVSTSANTQLIHWLHVDIRSEIHYWLSLAQQLHW